METKIPYGIKDQNVWGEGKGNTCKKKPAGGIGNPFKKSAQYRVVVKAEPYHGIGSRVHGEWYR